MNRADIPDQPPSDHPAVKMVRDIERMHVPCINVDSTVAKLTRAAITACMAEALDSGSTANIFQVREAAAKRLASAAENPQQAAAWYEENFGEENASWFWHALHSTAYELLDRLIPVDEDGLTP